MTAERADERDVKLLAGTLLLALFARVVYLRLLPEGAESLDFRYWLWLRGVFEARANPYGVTPYPPLWTQTLYLLYRASASTGIPFRHFIHAVLIAADLATIAAAHALLGRFAWVDRRARAWTIGLGLALNPVSILLVCQHGNVDVLVGLWVALAVLLLVSWNQRGDVADWLFAALCLGLGVLTKVVPIVLAPLLLVRIGEVSGRGRILGALLVLGPTALGLSVLHAVDPAHLGRVLAYRSIAGFHGVSGLLVAIGRPDWIAVTTAAFPILMIAATAALGVALLRATDAPDRAIVLAAALLLVIIPTFGPGYGPQYASWYLPLLIVLTRLYDGLLRGVLFTLLGVMVATYVVEYALLGSHGAALVRGTGSATLARAGERLDAAAAQTLLRAPLFLVSVAAVFASARRVLDDLSSPHFGEATPSSE